MALTTRVGDAMSGARRIRGQTMFDRAIGNRQHGRRALSRALFRTTGSAPAASTVSGVQRSPQSAVRAGLQRLVWSLALLAVCSLPARAQLPQTALQSVFPPGGAVGTEIEFRIAGGSDLDEVDQVVFNHAGITAEPKMQGEGETRQPVPNQFVVRIAEDVPPGRYEVRAVGLFGASNPRTFVVTDGPEVTETEGNNDRDSAMALELNAFVNAAANGNTDVDFYTFTGQAGQHVVIVCEAAGIDSQMMPAIEVFDAEDRRLGFERRRINQDPVLDLELPADGPYFVNVHDFLYRGGADFPYRLTVTTRPYLEFAVPPAGLPGTELTFAVYGRNLPGGEVVEASRGRTLQRLEVRTQVPERHDELPHVKRIDSTRAAIDGFTFSLDSPAGKSNPLLLQFASVPPIREIEPNDAPDTAQSVSIPGELVGQFQQRGDFDVFEFEAQAGEVYYIDVYGQRAGSTVDAVFELGQVQRNEAGEETGVKRLTLADDRTDDPGAPNFHTINDDPVFRFEVPSDGTYRLTLRDRYAAARGGADLVYRAVVRPENPDFRLVVLGAGPLAAANQPARMGTVALRRGDNQLLRVIAYRRDGFDGPIDLEVSNLPPGVECSGGIIGAGQSSADLVLTSAEDAPVGMEFVRVVGTAEIGKPSLQRQAERQAEQVAEAQKPLEKLQQAVEAAGKPLADAEQQLAQARDASQQKPEDEKLKQALQAAEQKRDQAQQALQKAQNELAEAEQKVADAQGELDRLRQEWDASITRVRHAARPATVVWAGDQNTPSEARLSQGVLVSVIGEPAPFQLKSDATRFEVAQGRQILIPMQLVKRNEFDNNVTLNLTGLPKNSKVQVQNKPINKGNDSELYRLYVDRTAPEGAYTLYFQSQGQVSYSRNPKRVERARAELEKVAEQASQADAALKQVTQARDQARKAMMDAETRAKQAAEKATALQKMQQDLAAALKKAEADKTEAEKQAAAAREQVQAAQKQVQEARKASEEAAEDETLKKALAQAEQELKTAQDAAAKATADATSATEAHTAAAKALAEAEAELTAARKASEQAAADAKTATEALQKAEADVKTADAAAKAAASAKSQAEKEVKDAENAAKPKNINHLPPSPGFVLVVKPAPAYLTAAVPSGGNLKRGESIDVKVTVNRMNDYAGPVTLTLPLPSGVSGLSAEPVVIPAGEKEGVLTITASQEATEGQIENLVIRGQADVAGPGEFDVPITLKVAK